MGASGPRGGEVYDVQLVEEESTVTVMAALKRVVESRWPELSSTSLRECLGFFAENQRLTKQMGFGDAQPLSSLSIISFRASSAMASRICRINTSRRSVGV